VLVDYVATKHNVDMDIADVTVKIWRNENDITVAKIKDGRSWPSIFNALKAADLKPLIEDEIPF